MPPLHTTSVGLRPWGNAPSDAEVLVRAWQDPDVARWTRVPQPPNVETARTWLAGEGSRRENGVAMDLAITPVGRPEEVLGEIGFVVISTENRWAEVGYWLFPEARGRGVATAALQMLTNWAVIDQRFAQLVAQTKTANEASSRVAAAAGYSLAGEVDGGTSVWTYRASEVHSGDIPE